MSKISKSEKCLIKDGNIRASYLKFRLNEHEVSDDDNGDSDIDKDFNENCSRANIDENIVDLSNQKISIFTETTVLRPEAVKYLYLQNNKLTQLPCDLFKIFNHLEWLDMRNNLTREIPQMCGNAKYG